MTKDEAVEILSGNVLDLSEAGFLYLPINKVRVGCIFSLDYDMFGEKGSIIYGVIEDDGDVLSYLVQVGKNEYKFVEYFEDMTRVCEALKFVYPERNVE